MSLEARIAHIARQEIARAAPVPAPGEDLLDGWEVQLKDLHAELHHAAQQVAELTKRVEALEHTSTSAPAGVEAEVEGGQPAARRARGARGASS